MALIELSGGIKALSNIVYFSLLSNNIGYTIQPAAFTPTRVVHSIDRENNIHI